MSHPFELSHISAVHLLKSLTKHLKSGQWEYLLSLTVIIQTPQAVFSFFFHLLMLQQRNLHHLISASYSLSLSSICSLMHSLKRTGGVKVGFGFGVGSQRGIYSPRFLTRCVVSRFDPLWMLLTLFCLPFLFLFFFSAFLERKHDVQTLR